MSAYEKTIHIANQNRMTNAKRVTTKDLMKEIENLKLKVMEVDNLKRKIAVLENDLQTLKNENGFKAANVQNVIKCSTLLMTSRDMINQSMIRHQLIVVRVIKFSLKIVILNTILK